MSGQRFTVDSLVNGRGPFPLLVDTGAERSLISNELAASVDGRPGAKVRLSTLAGKKIYPTLIVDGLRVGPLSLRGLAMAQVPQSAIGASGVLGIDALKSARLTFDFRAQTVRIERTLPQEPVSSDAIIVEARVRKHWLLIREARVAGRKVALIIDSGSEVSIANPEMRQLLDREVGRGDPSSVTLCGLTGNLVVGEQRTLKQLTFGPIELTTVPIVFLDSPIFGQLGLDGRPALIIGMETLRAFDRVTIDYPASRFVFVLGNTSATPD